MRRSSLLAALALVAVSGSCRDATGPGFSSESAAGMAPRLWHLSADRTGDGIGDSELSMLQQSSSAPLDAYAKSFRACRDKSQTLRIRYARLRRHDSDADGRGRGTSDLFLELTIPRRSLSRHPGGRRFRRSDCVTIRVSVDPDYLVARFEPGGLKFSRSRPARLRMWYARANPDLNGDGVVDRRDEDIRNHSLGIWRLPHSDQPWHPVGAVHYRDARRFEAELYEFSHYAVAH